MINLIKNYLNDKIYVAGHNGLVGSAVVRQLKHYGFKNILIISKKELNLKNKNKVFKFLKKNKPKHLIIAAAKVGGIKINNENSAEFIFDNLEIQNNLIHCAHLNNIKNLIFLGSSCIYPRNCDQPIKEKYLLTGELEKTNEAYAIAKIAGVKLCQFYNRQYGYSFKSIMPCNTFGPNDNYNLNSSHFIPALIKKIYLAKKNNKNFIYLWGDGRTKREAIFVDDLANAIIYFLFKKTKIDLINIGTQKDFQIKYYARTIMRLFGVNFDIKYVNKKLTGTPRKILDCTLARNLGWQNFYSLTDGLRITINDFLKKYNFYK